MDAAGEAAESTKRQSLAESTRLGSRFNETGAAAQGLQRLDLPGSNQHWQVHLDPQTHLILGDHALLKQPVFAAAGYLALLLDWRQQCQ